MTIVRRPTRFGELMTLRSAVDRLFDDDVFRPFQQLGSIAFDGAGIPLDVTTDADALTVEAALARITPEDVEITVENGTLTITGTTREARKAEEGSYLVQEIRRGTFSRSLTLPNGLEPDKAEATFEHGVLKLRIPKAEQLKPRQIKITPVTDGNGQRPSSPAAAPSDQR